jgi:hypothetical protein
MLVLEEEGPKDMLFYQEGVSTFVFSRCVSGGSSSIEWLHQNILTVVVLPLGRRSLLKIQNFFSAYSCIYFQPLPNNLLEITVRFQAAVPVITPAMLTDVSNELEYSHDTFCAI